MKILCIEKVWGLTKGKWYTVIKEDDDSYLIINDLGNEWWYPKSCFKIQQEIRDEKLKEIGI